MSVTIREMEAFQVSGQSFSILESVTTHASKETIKIEKHVVAFSNEINREVLANMENCDTLKRASKMS